MISALHIPQPFVTSKNPVLFRLTSNMYSQPNHFFTSIVEINGYAGQRIVNLIEFIFDANAQQPYASIDIRRLLEDYLDEIDYPLPVFNDTAGRLVNITTFLTCTFFVKHYESFGTPPVLDPTFYRWPNAGTALCLKGGFSYPNFPQLKYAHDWILQFHSNTPFLTWKPTSSLISYDQHEFLTFLNYSSSVSSLSLQYIVEFADGTSIGGNFSAFGSAQGRIHRVNVGPSALDLASLYPGSNISYYEVWLESGVTQASEIRRYYVDYRSYPATRYIYFVNSLGGLDCMRFVGLGEFTAEYKREIGDQFQGQYNNNYGFQKTLSASESAGYKINTGYISRAEVHWLRDLFLSKQVFILQDGRLYPISVSSKKLSLPEEADVNSLSIEFSYQFENSVFTPSYQNVP